MKGRLFLMTIFFSAAIMLISGIFYLDSRQRNSEDINSEQIVAVNELEQLALRGDFDALSQKSIELQNKLHSMQANSENACKYFILSGICVVFFAVAFCYIHFAILNPFNKMKIFAEKIAQGNFDFPLEYDRSNYFGEFTWAFDSMRMEITRARSCEKEAIENNKTVIATLSHDIKTPIASIRAYTEGLEANMDTSPEKRARYLATIVKKCDEVSRLTNDLFIHSISDLDKLKITEEKEELCEFMKNALEEISDNNSSINLTLPKDTINVLVDKNRLLQVCENIINNSRKYAKTKIDINVIIENGFAEIHFKDYGPGIPNEDMPFIFGKFYRGKNCGNEQGSGLGLYIVKYIIEKMRGRVLLYNQIDGFEVTLFLPIV